MDRIKAVWIKHPGGYECSHCGVVSEEPEDDCPYCDSDMTEVFDNEVQTDEIG